MISKEEFKQYLDNRFKDSDGAKILNNYNFWSKFEKFRIVVIVFTCTFAFLCLLFSVLERKLLFFLSFAFLIFFISLLSHAKKCSMAINSFANANADEIISYLFQGYRIEYRHSSMISSYIVNECDFIKYYDLLYGEDYLSVVIPSKDRINSSVLCMSDVIAECKTEDKDGNESYYTVFKGIIGKVTFNNSFKCELVINSPSHKNLSKVSLEDISFNKKYKVYGSDQVEARYILTPVMMEYIDKLDKFADSVSGYDDKLMLSFKNNSLFFAIKGKIDMFGLKKKHVSSLQEIFLDYYDYVSLIMNLIEEIKSNNKIFKM